MRRDVSPALPNPKIPWQPHRPPLAFIWLVFAFVWMALPCIALCWPSLAFVGLLVAS
jgi:hypothetical protein